MQLVRCANTATSLHLTGLYCTRVWEVRTDEYFWNTTVLVLHSAKFKVFYKTYVNILRAVQPWQFRLGQNVNKLARLPCQLLW